MTCCFHCRNNIVQSYSFIFFYHDKTPNTSRQKIRLIIHTCMLYNHVDDVVSELIL